ncbi:TfuA-like protein [Sorangium sp. So ce1000]|uniref:TfuA-like protein n=1 Tax=Sorangium sp. So ce1000 TaxID=3133325 RepID=UPI003F61F3B7
MKAVIFLGPSLPLHEAREILDAIYLPPAQQTDLLTATVNHRPDVIGLIDGVFQQTLSVWHKEILYALDQGIRVYGASSMGALRAAETDAFGMIGVGEIYRQYASGEIIDDDEVALAHAEADQGYRKVSEPMVNMRATFAAAERAGLLDGGQRSRLEAIAKQLYFAERSFPAVLRAAADDGFAPALVESVSRFVKTNYVDQKKQDAMALLRTVKELPATQRKPEKAFSFSRSTFFETLYNRDRRVEQDDVALPLETIGNYVALNDPEFDALNFAAMNRIVVFAFAQILGLEATEKEIDAELARFRRQRALGDDESLSSWLAQNHLSDEELRQLMAQLVCCRRLHRWFLLALWMDRTTKVTLDELRLSNRYAEWAARAATQERLLARAKTPGDHAGALRIPLEELLSEHQKWTDCRVHIDASTWAEEAGFHSESNLRMELSQARAARRALLELLSASMPDEPGAAAPQTEVQGSAERPGSPGKA